jgi:glutathione S-transferase
VLTLHSYPGLFGVADNNPFGLKAYAFMRLCGLHFEHRHILDASHAPRGQLPYLLDGDKVVGDSDAIIDHLRRRYRPRIDLGLSESQKNLDVLVRRMLDDLYWPMSYSRWRDDRFWPAFRDALLAIYGFVANIYFFDIDTPLKRFVEARPDLVRHCRAMHARCQAA